MRDIQMGLVRLTFLSLAFSGFLAGCATSPSAPPPGAPQMPGPNWPPVGSTWVNNEKFTGSFGNSTSEVTNTFVGKKPFEGREVMAITNAVDTLYFNDQGNFIARLRGDAVLDRCDPFVLSHEFPLFVGKRWGTTFTYRDLEHKRTFSGVHQDVVVETYEEVQTPAGRLNAFKITRGDAYYRMTYWISPDLGIYAKWREERLSGHYLGPGLHEGELASYSFAK